MSYQDHPSCITPKNLKTKIWRYMDFTKFLSILEESALFFSNLSILSDPLEGFLTKPTVDKFRGMPEDLSSEEVKKRLQIGELNLQFFKRSRTLLYVSSWHMSNFESVAMWEMYVKTGEGIAIQSTVGRMKKAFSNIDEPINIGKVKYVDYDKQEIPWNNLLHLAIHKRKSFEYERELRAIVTSTANSFGIIVPTDLNCLISKIYIGFPE